jgi:serine/threonine protein kinase
MTSRHTSNGRRFLKTSRRELNRDRVSQKYEMLGKIGAGKFSSVHRARSKLSGNLYAIKFIEKSRLLKDEAELLKNETSIMKVLDHPNCIRLHESFETLEYLYYVIELVEGQDLYRYVNDRVYLEEIEASQIMSSIFSAVGYLHSLGIIHRDLKPENVMLQLDPKDENKIQNVKLIDFGFSIYYEELQLKKTACGTLNYTAPEILSGEDYDYKCDCFSLGVITYYLVKGELPFHNDTHEILIKNILEGNYPMEGDEFFFNVSEEGKDLISKLLETDPEKRISIAEAQQHPWITNRENLKRYYQRNKQDTFDVGNFVNFN